MQSKTLHLISIFMKQILYLGTLGIIYDHLKTKKMQMQMQEDISYNILKLILIRCRKCNSCRYLNFIEIPNWYLPFSLSIKLIISKL
jgi:hypothetical protein